MLRKKEGSWGGRELKCEHEVGSRNWNTPSAKQVLGHKRWAELGSAQLPRTQLSPFLIAMVEEVWGTRLVS